MGRLVFSRTLSVFGFLYGLSLAQQSTAQVLASDTTWHATDPIRTLAQSVQIPVGKTLTIEAGAAVNGNGNTIRVAGALKVLGTSAAMVHLNDVDLECGDTGVFATACNILLFDVVFDGGRLLNDVISPGGMIITDSVIKHVGLPADLMTVGSTGTNSFLRNAFIDTPQIYLSAGKAPGLVLNNLFYTWHSSAFSPAAILLNSTIGNIAVHQNSFLQSSAKTVVALDGGFNSGQFNSADMLADHNFWDTTDINVVRTEILDRYVDITRNGVVPYAPILTAPDPLTPTLASANPNSSGLLSSVLPTSRSVTTAQSATIYASFINAGTGDFGSCTIVPRATGNSTIPRGIPQGSFSFVQTNPATNSPAGTVNAPFPLTHGQTRTFVLTFTPNSAMPPADIGAVAQCDGADDATVLTGIGSAVISFNASPTADVIALAATSQNDGIVHIPGVNGTGAFAVATANVGVAADVSITPTIGTGTAIAAICQTVPSTGACLATPANSVRTRIGPNETPTFAIFVAGKGTAIPLDPANQRVTLKIIDTGNALRGSTSVALTTQ